MTRNFNSEPRTMVTQKILIKIFFLFFICTIRNVQSQNSVVHHQQASSYGCECQNYSCGCCAHVEVPKVGLNDTACANLSYLAKEYGISFTLTIDNLTIYNETISARNPPPICFGAPMLKEFADLCIHFYDLNVTYSTAHGCVELEARLHKIVVGKYKLGCFNLGKVNEKPAVILSKPVKYKKSTYIPKHFILKMGTRNDNT